MTLMRGVEAWLDNCTFRNCSSNRGGAIFNRDSKLKISKSYLEYNTADDREDICYDVIIGINPKLEI